MKGPKSKKPKRPQISDAELIVMKILWERGLGTANQVVEALSGRIKWKPKTTQTLLARLVQKGALRYDKTGREYVFYPLIGRQDYVHSAAISFLQRVFNGQVAPFLSCLLEREELTNDEIAELKRLLDEKARSQR